MMRRAISAAVAFAATQACASEPAIPRYADVTASSGLFHTFTGEWTFIVGGGAAVFDCDGDLRPDVYLAGGTSPARLFRNTSSGGGTLSFTPVEGELELTEVVGAYPIDIDGDGITDLAVLRVGPDFLMRGRGDCRFADAGTEWSFDGLDLWSTAFAATWERGEAWPTLAVGTYIDRTQEAFPWGSCTSNHLYRPGGTGFGAPLDLAPAFCPLSMLFTDWNRSGEPALRVSNDREYYKGGQEQLWHFGAGRMPRLYTEAEGWTRLRIWGMGIAATDLTLDGYPDFFLTSMADNKLQVLAEVPATGAPAPRYVDIAFDRGATAHRPHTGGDLRPSTAWHAEFADVNNDGLADLFIAKGNVWSMPDFAERDPNNLLLQRADGTFQEAAEAAGVASLRQGRGGAVADFDLDGRLDLLVVNRNEPAEVWRNDGGFDGAWLQLRLSQPGANRDAVGAVVQVRRGDGALVTREIAIGGGHAGDSLGWEHFGLGEADGSEIRVTWPDGTEGPWQRVQADGFYLVARDREPQRIEP